MTADPPAPRSEGRSGPGSSLWPLLGLRIRTPRLELRLPTEEEAFELFARVPDDYESDPAAPAPAGPRQVAFLQQFWRALGNWKLDDWRVPLGVWHEGEAIGQQELEARNFATLRTVESSSFLVPSARGTGLGKEMRRAVLSLAFDHLGAEYAKSGAWDDNAASLGVSRAVGYADNGWDPHEREGARGVMRRVLLQRKDWRPATDVEVAGLDACREWFGV